MYKCTDNTQNNFLGFNQPIGLHMNPENRWIKMAEVHSVENRIVSILQPWIRPIVRGKTKAPIELGAKFDLSVDDSGLGRIEKISYDAYNESTVFVFAQMVMLCFTIQLKSCFLNIR